jgi:hypothetical protein
MVQWLSSVPKHFQYQSGLTFEAGLYETMPLNRGENGYHGHALNWQGKDKSIYTDERPDYIFETASWQMEHSEIEEYKEQLREAGIHTNLDTRFRLSDIKGSGGKNL